MTEFLACPACGGTTFEQDRTTTCEETHAIAFSPKGDIEGQDLVDRDVIEEVSAGAYRCEDCGWELVEENGQPITHPDEIVTKIKQAAQAVAPRRTPDDIPDDGWHELGAVTIDTATLLLVDPVHQGRVDAVAGEGQIAIPGGDFSAVQVPTGIGDGRYRVEGRAIESPIFGRRIAEIRVRFLDEDGNWLGADASGGKR